MIVKKKKEYLQNSGRKLGKGHEYRMRKRNEFERLFSFGCLQRLYK